MNLIEISRQWKFVEELAVKIFFFKGNHMRAEVSEVLPCNFSFSTAAFSLPSEHRGS